MSEFQPTVAYTLTPEHLASERVEVSNTEFLCQAFQRQTCDQQGSKAVVVSFPGHPGRDGYWLATPFDGTNAPETDKTNNYFSISAFAPDAQGTYRRQKANFAGQYVVALDDVVQEVVEGKNKAQIPLTRITLPPTYVLETSAGNYQVGYFLSTPLTDIEKADCLSKAIIDAGLSDPGAGGPTARLMRLPKGCNGKYAPVFQCALRLWMPQLRYSMDQITKGLGLSLQRSSSQLQVHRSCAGACCVKPEGANSVYTPPPTQNATLGALHERGLIKRDMGHGKYEITCPWVHEHTDQLDTGSVYWAPDEAHPLGAFKCQHGHCVGRGIIDLLNNLGIEPESAYMKARITIDPGEVNRIVMAAEQELARTGRYFQRGGRIVTIDRTAIGGRLRVMEANPQSLLVDLCAVTRWQKFDGRSKRMMVCDPSPKYLAAILEGGKHNNLPELVGISRQPTINSNGHVQNRAGYNAENGLYGDFTALDYSVPSHPTKQDALDACERLEELLLEFPFDDAQIDKSATLSAMLTATVRAQLRVAPMFHVKAHVPGSGKSYLTSLISVFATEGEVAASSFPKDDEECRKFLLAQLLQAPPAIVFDNLTTDIYAHKSLCMALTETTINGRVLGVSRTVDVSTRALILSSGNNVGPVQDMTRRVMSIHLNPQEANPATREFGRPNLIEEVRNKRGIYISCALTMITAWIQAGCPKTENVRSLGSFSQWSDWCRQPLLWLGRQDPAERLFETLVEDPEREQVGLLFACLVTIFETRPFTVKDVAIKVGLSDWKSDENDILESAGLKTNGVIDRRRLGWWFKHHEGWSVNGVKLIRIRVKGKQPTYRLMVEGGF